LEQERQAAGFSTEGFAVDADPSPAQPRNSQLLLQEEAFDVGFREPSQPRGVVLVSPIPIIQQESESQSEVHSGIASEKQISQRKSLEEKTGEITVTFWKSDLQQKLGVDLKHCEGCLVVQSILEGSAIARLADTGKQESLMIGDKIVKINSVKGDSDKMVAACQDALALTFHVVREN